MRPRRFDARAAARRRWGPASVLRRALEVARAEGWRTLWFRVLGETVYRRLIVMERPFLQPVARGDRSSLDFGLLARDELAEYLALRPDAEREETADRFARGHVCFVARSEGRLVAACWAGRGRCWVEYLGVWVDLARDVGYLYDLYVAPVARGLGVYTGLFDFMRDYYGYGGEVTTVLATPNPETRTHRLFGAARLRVRDDASHAAPPGPPDRVLPLPGRPALRRAPRPALDRMECPAPRS